MPGRDGFDVVAQTGDMIRHVIFVTAFDQYAVRAFDVQALDYLLKPFDRARLEKALERACAQIRGEGDLREQLVALVEQVRPDPRPIDRMMVKSPAALRFSASTRSTGSKPPTATCAFMPAGKGISSARR